MGRSLLRALSPRSIPALGVTALGTLSLPLPQLQPLAQRGPSDLERGRNLVPLRLVTALSYPPPAWQLMHLSLLS